MVCFIFGSIATDNSELQSLAKIKIKITDNCALWDVFFFLKKKTNIPATGTW